MRRPTEAPGPCAPTELSPQRPASGEAGGAGGAHVSRTCLRRKQTRVVVRDRARTSRGRGASPQRLGGCRLRCFRGGGRTPEGERRVPPSVLLGGRPPCVRSSCRVFSARGGGSAGLHPPRAGETLTRSWLLRRLPWEQAKGCVRSPGAEPGAPRPACSPRRPRALPGTCRPHSRLFCVSPPSSLPSRDPPGTAAANATSSLAPAYARVLADSSPSASVQPSNVAESPKSLLQHIQDADV